MRPDKGSTTPEVVEHSFDDEEDFAKGDRCPARSKDPAAARKEDGKWRMYADPSSADQAYVTSSLPQHQADGISLGDDDLKARPFATRPGHRPYMPHGLKNAGTTLQRFMHRHLRHAKAQAGSPARPAW